MNRPKNPQKQPGRIDRREFCKTVPCAAIGVLSSSSLWGVALKGDNTSLFLKKSSFEKEGSVAEKITSVKAKVISQKGTCALGHKVGDEVEFTENKVDGNICMYALYSILPMVFALGHDAKFEWADDPDVIASACPDHLNPVVFEIKRIREK